jgi:hypothetical protein
VGPLIASLFMAMVRIYRRDFLGITQPALPPPPAEPPPDMAPAVLEVSTGLSASSVKP